MWLDIINLILLTIILMELYKLGQLFYIKDTVFNIIDDRMFKTILIMTGFVFTLMFVLSVTSNNEELKWTTLRSYTVFIPNGLISLVILKIHQKLS